MSRASLSPDARPSLARDIPLRSLLLLGILIGGMIPLLVVSLVGYGAVRGELKAQAFRQLRSVRDIKITLLGKFYFERRADIRVFAANPYLGQAYADLAAAWRGPAGRSVRNRYAPFLGSLVREYEYDDLLLLDPENGRIVFSNRSGESSPGRTLPPGLAAVWNAARSGQPGISDLDQKPGLDPAGAVPQPAQYLAAPIRAGTRIIGVVAVRIAPQAVEAIMQDRSGLGRTGVTFIVGSDGRIRAPIPADESAAALGQREIWAEMARGNASGDRIGPGRAGRTALSAFAPLGLPGLEWTLLAEIDESEIDRQIALALNPRILPILGLSVVLLAALALLISRFVALGVRRVIGEIRRLIRDVLDGRLRSRAKVAAMAADFRPVLRGINELVEALESQIEARRRLEEHVRDSQRLEAIGRLAGGIAHDFNNLLAHMRALAYIIERENATGCAVDPERLEEMTLSIRRGMDLVRQILTFSRPGQGAEATVDLREIAAETMKIVRAALPAGVEATFEAGPDRLPVRGDPSQIRQIVMNLCVNAIQAMQESGGRLIVSLAATKISGEDGEAWFARLSIEDSGPGIPLEIQERIFEPFFTTKADGQGSGLGLSIVNGIVMALGGSVAVDSTIGGGSRFDVCMPLAEPPRTKP
ncbi:MAG: ATP-binding protein [Candidatus Aminicenantes bacterium]|nr:ATP-binding protein [Candidatus Aminicenantes bacterium]